MKGKLISFFALIILLNSWNALSQTVGISVDIKYHSNCSQNGMFIANEVGLAPGDISYWQLTNYPTSYAGPSSTTLSPTFNNLTPGSYALNLFHKSPGDSSFNTVSTLINIKRESYYFDTVVTEPTDSMGNFKVFPNLFITSIGSCIDTIMAFPDSVNCSNGNSQSIILSIKENDGSIYNETVTINLTDLIAPNVNAKNITKFIDSSGNLQVTASEIDDGSSDNCEVLLSVSPSSFSCTDLGVNSIVLSGIDRSNNISSDSALITIIDNIHPTLIINPTFDVYIDGNGFGFITTSDIDNGSSDNCDLSTSIDRTTFNCSDIPNSPISVTFTATDPSGNTSNISSLINVFDTNSPVIITKDVTINLNASNNAIITTSDIDNGSFDNCTPLTLSLSQTSFNCSDVGLNQVTLTGTDRNGNSSSTIANVIVVDNLAPTALCKPATIYLNAQGTATLTTTDINNGSSDNCSVYLSLSQTTFNCSYLGNNIVSLIATDDQGLSATCSSIVNVVDLISPTMICKPIVINLDANGNKVITASDIDNGSFDNCSSLNLSLSKSTFDCNDLGIKLVTLTGTDASGNSSSFTDTVTVIDNIAPTLRCKPITVSLSSSGFANITVSDIDDGSFDNCNLLNLTLSKNTFNCSNLGSNTVVLSGIDSEGNSSSCTTVVSVIDNIAPIMSCKPITIYLDSNGNAVINPTDLNNGSSDNCSSLNLVLSQSTFNCSNIGVNSVTLSGTDASGNTSSCSSLVTIIDSAGPITAFINTTSSTICKGSGTTLSANSGSGYTYSWSDGISLIGTSQTITVRPNSTNTYSVTVTSSSGCISRVAYDTIHVTPLTNATITGPDSICLGDIATLIANAGTNYLWSNGDTTQSINVNPSSSTSYFVNVTNNGCQSTSSILNLIINPLPNINVGNDETICQNSPLTIAATGGNSYSWNPVTGLNSSSTANPIANPSATTIYEVVGTDLNGCKNKDQIMITVINLPNPSITGIDTVCQNSYLNSYKAAPSPNTMEWSSVNGRIQGYLGGINNPLVHWYNIGTQTQLILKETESINNCQNSDTLSILFSNDSSLDPVEIQPLSSSSNILVSSINHQTMNWGMESKLTRNPIYLNQSGQYCQYTFIDTFNYYYWVEIGNGNNCLTKSYYNGQQFYTSLTEKNISLNNIKLYPNPASNFIFLTGISKANSAYIFDHRGRLMGKVLLQGDNTVNFDISDYSPGIYIIKVISDANMTTMKFIKTL